MRGVSEMELLAKLYVELLLTGPYSLLVGCKWKYNGASKKVHDKQQDSNKKEKKMRR